MATSPDYLRLASNATRALADTALDSMRNAVLVVDARQKHLPLVLANAAARRCLAAEGNSTSLLEAPLARLLGTASTVAIETMVASQSGAECTGRIITWRFLHGEQAVMTDIKALAAAPGQRLLMLSFLPEVPATGAMAAVEQLSLDMLILDTDLKVTYANAGAVRTAASVPGGVIGCSALMLTPTLALHPDIYARALEGRHFHDDALAFVEPGRPTRLFNMDVQPLRSGSRIVGLIVLTVEVTESSFNNPAGSNRRLLALTEHARDMILVAGADGCLQYVSGGVRNSLGYTFEERESNHVFDHIHPDDLGELRTQFQKLIAGEISGFLREFRIRHKDGTYRWLEARYVSALDNPLIRGVVINSRDVTERKLAEFKLGQREEVFRLAAAAVDGVIFEWDIVRGVVHRSRGVQEVMGIPPEDLESSIGAWFARIHPRDFTAAKNAVGLALIDGRGWTTTYRLRDASGRYKSMLERGLIQRNAAGDPVRAIGCCVDVSEIKRLTDILGETQRSAKIGGWEYGYATRELTWTDEMFHIYDTNPRDFPVSWESMQSRWLPDSAQQFREACRQAEAAGGRLDLELEINTLKNQRIWVRVIGHLELLDGRPFRAFGSVQNIQAQKLAQIALENSTAWLKQSMNMAYMHAWRWDKESDSFEFANLDGDPDKGPNFYPDMRTTLSHVHPQDQAKVARAIDHAFTHQVEVREEFQLLDNKGHYRAYATTARPVFDGAAPRGMVGVIQDVTARRDSERRLRQSEELLRATTTNTADTLFLLDTALQVRFVNKSVNGMAIDEIIGREMKMLLPQAARARVLETLAQILQTGETATYEFEAVMEGAAKFYENRAVLVREDGVGTGISISMRDITERKRLEQEIVDVSARERQSIGRDLHDGLGQELTGVALMLRAVSGQMRRCPDLAEKFNEIVGHVNQSIETARTLARGLLPVRDETGGLPFALRTLAARSRDLYGLEVNFRAEVSRDFAFNETNASHLYRIAQEALTNAARHGRATLVDIFLRAAAHGFSLQISDDGEGVPRAAANSTGMGLKIMKYRADTMGAQFNIEANVPRGTVVTVAG